ncbi:pentatricopeptide repeat domain-containing protein [Colletotrichum camelliae]|nr:pentatricopeptide repeat domain-containing protein [Colletotrichum camelliae]
MQLNASLQPHVIRSLARLPDAMLASRTVCARCRTRLLAGAIATGTTRPNSTASFPSVTTEQPSDKTAQPPRVQASEASPNKTRQRRSKEDVDAKKRALDLFESAINKSKGEEAVTPETPHALEKLARLAKTLGTILNSNLKKNITVEIATRNFTMLKTEVLPNLRDSKVPQPILMETAQALRQLIEFKLVNTHAKELPSLTDLCRLMSDFGNVKPLSRLRFINSFLNAILPMLSKAKDTANVESATVEERSLQDLVDFWKHFSALRRVDSGLQSEPKFWLTSRPDLRNSNQPVKLFRLLLHSVAANEVVGLDAALVTTYVLLSDPAYEHTKARGDAAPLLEALEPIIKRFDRENLHPIFEAQPRLWQYVEPRADWRVIQAAPNALSESASAAPDGSTPKHGKFAYALWHKRFNMAYRGNDHAAVQQAWRDLIKPPNDASRAVTLRRCPELFDYILHIACHKSRYEKDIYTQVISEVLEYMKAIGLEPTIRTYTSMMEGWKLAKRLEPIEHMWESITKAGLKLDHQIWSSRISALGGLGAGWDGIRALTQMDRAWQEAVKNGREDQALKPAMSNVNAAISGLLWRDRMDGVKKVLEWASERDLQPDIYTFNMLLSRMLKQGKHEEADRILCSMKAAGVKPDGATFTIIMDTAFADISEQSPKEQRATIENVFREMAACGIDPNQETYAKMIHSLLRQGDVARSSITAVLAHLRANGQQPSTEICTMLVEYFIDRDQPDLDTVRALVDDRRSRARALTDRVFWETVIKYYHRADNLDGALEIVYDLDDWGIWPGLPLLEPLLRSLLRRKDWDAAKKLVGTVRRQPRSEAADRENRYWKHAFWAVARDYDLIDRNAEVVQN